MKKIVVHIIILFSFVSILEAQLNTSGTIVNRGTVMVKKKTIKQNGGNIDNEDGLIVTTGTVTEFTQNTLMGRIDYTRSDNQSKQHVPQINYWDIRFFGESDKNLVPYSLDSNLNLTSLSRFYSDTSVKIDFDTKYRINTHGYVTHKGHVNWGTYFGWVSMNGTDAQDIDGKGEFKELQLDNFNGADVINTGGFRVNTTLELKQGEFRNNDSNNFAMVHDSKIVRHTGASIQDTPVFEGDVSVHYVGDGEMLTGPELPVDTTILADLVVRNVDGITLSTDVTSNRDLIVETVIKTEEDIDNKHVLTSTAAQDPQFVTTDAEIIGSFRRTTLKYNDERMLFNNRFTYVLFANQDDANGITEMTLRVIPKAFPPNAEPDTKVERDIAISARDENYAPVTAALRFELGYGWRHTADARHETNNLPVPDVMLQRWEGATWEDNTTSQVPQVNSADGWAYSTATTVSQLGQFAIGISATGQLFVMANAMLEGPYRWGSMANDIRMKGLLPNTPPDVYPHNIDPNRGIVHFDSLNPNAVDWVMLEFQDVDSSDIVFYKHCLVLSDGAIIDSNGQNIKIPEAGYYKVTIRHRNHLAVMSKDTVRVFPGLDPDLVDFSRPETYGQPFDANSYVKIMKDNNDRTFYALLAGDANGDGLIDLVDYDQEIWNNRDSEGYNLWDITLSGITHTRDLNMSWNNRGKQSMVNE